GRARPSALERAATDSAGARSERREAGVAGETETRGPAAWRPARGSLRWATSAMEPRSLFVDEDGARDLDLDGAARHRHVERLADTAAPRLDQRQRYRAAAVLGPVGRGDVADHRHRDRVLRVLDDLSPLLQHHLRIAGLQAHELLAARRLQIGPLQPANADEVGLVLADRPGQAAVVRRHRAVGLLADDDVTLFGAQHMHRLGAVGAGAVLLSFDPDRLPHRL